MGGSDCEESTFSVRDLGSTPGFGRSLGEGNGYPLRYSGLENSMDRGAWWTTVKGVDKSQIQLSDFHTHILSLVRIYHVSTLISGYLLKLSGHVLAKVSTEGK